MREQRPAQDCGAVSLTIGLLKWNLCYWLHEHLESWVEQGPIVLEQPGRPCGFAAARVGLWKFGFGCRTHEARVLQARREQVGIGPAELAQDFWPGARSA